MDELYTGRSFVLFKRASAEQFMEWFNRLINELRRSTALFKLASNSKVDTEGHLYEEWGVAIVPYPPERVAELIRREEFGLEAVENERFVEATGLMPSSTVTTVTPGLKLTKVDTSNETGDGVGVAVLDTGFDFRHPDFPASRFADRQSFTGDDVQDSTHGHGTHTAGTACGPLTSQLAGQRYGIAYKSSIVVARVLDPAGLGFDQWVLDALRWVKSKNVQIVQMCFGAPAGGPKACMERVASQILNDGVLIIAAGGNRNNNPVGQPPDPVDYPANCRSIFAAAAVTNQAVSADFSCGGLDDGTGGEINVSAPGIDVLSAAIYDPPHNRPGYFRAKGTSMATAHVVGIAALRCKRGAYVGRALWNDIVQHAEPKNRISQYLSGALVIAP